MSWVILIRLLDFAAIVALVTLSTLTRKPFRQPGACGVRVGVASFWPERCWFASGETDASSPSILGIVYRNDEAASSLGQGSGIRGSRRSARSVQRRHETHSPVCEAAGLVYTTTAKAFRIPANAERGSLCLLG